MPGWVPKIFLAQGRHFCLSPLAVQKVTTPLLIIQLLSCVAARWSLVALCQHCNKAITIIIIIIITIIIIIIIIIIFMLPTSVGRMRYE